MKTELRRAVLPAEISALRAFDHKVFPKSDWFSTDDWKIYESWWMIIGNTKVGCCAFERNVDFQDDLRDDHINPPLQGSLYVSTTGILPRFQGQGFGSMLKCWQISYARYHRFHRIVTNTRASNAEMIRLNKRFGFKALRTTPGYYENPLEATVVMERRLDSQK